MIDISALPPTLSCSDVAKLKKCSAELIRKEVQNIPGAYRTGSGWQIPKESLNIPPLSELPRKRGRKSRQS